MPKIQVAAQGAPGHDPRTDTLRLVMEPLLAQDKCLAYWWYADGWRSDPGGELQYAFIAPIDAAELRKRFSFPVSIQVREGGFIKDRPNRLAVIQMPARLTFVPNF